MHPYDRLLVSSRFSHLVPEFPGWRCKLVLFFRFDGPGALSPTQRVSQGGWGVVCVSVFVLYPLANVTAAALFDLSLHIERTQINYAGYR